LERYSGEQDCHLARVKVKGPKLQSDTLKFLAPVEIFVPDSHFFVQESPLFVQESSKFVPKIFQIIPTSINS